jgi:transcriptional regulator with XRE-family HTH domain
MKSFSFINDVPAQEKLAEYIGVSKAAVSKSESGQSYPESANRKVKIEIPPGFEKTDELFGLHRGYTGTFLL